MVIHRPHRGSLDAAMAEKREFKSLKECLETLIKEHNMKAQNFTVSINDICIMSYGQDERVGWRDMFIICCVPYSEVKDKKGYLTYYGDKYDHPLQLFGFISTDYEL